MGWLKLHVDCAAAQVEDAAELLQRFGAESVSIAPLTAEPVFGGAADTAQYWQGNRVSALYPPGVEPDIVLACLRNRIGVSAIHAHGIEAVGEIDWQGRLHDSTGARLYGNRLCICPGWSEPLPAEHLLMLDPGLAFGSGTHATTRLCLEWLVQAGLDGVLLIDYGCGSGVLGLAACLLGARQVDAVDTDALALAATAANAARNGLSERLRVHGGAAPVLQPADVLIANILLDTLVDCAPRFAALVRPGGRIALSGLLETQVDECCDAYRPWFNMSGPQFDGEWALLHGRRKP